MCRDFGIEYTRGIDASQVAVTMARKMVPSSQFLVRNTDDAKELFQDNSYRTCVLIEVLEHIYKDLALIRMIPEGRLVVLTVPNFQTEGHVRWFSSKKQVVDRYSKVLKIIKVVEEYAKETSNHWWIVKGERKK